MNQPDLFDPRARNTDPVTSHQAADQSDNIAEDHWKVIRNWLSDNPKGGTSHEIGNGTKLGYHAVGRRMKEMEKRGWAARTGETRLTPHNRQAQVWIRPTLKLI
jgi:hypothetical protein